MYKEEISLLEMKLIDFAVSKLTYKILDPIFKKKVRHSKNLSKDRQFRNLSTIRTNHKPLIQTNKTTCDKDKVNLVINIV